MKQVTLIALYGNKPQSLLHLFSECQRLVKEEFPKIFVPYQMAQIHATIVSLERMSNSAYINKNYFEYRQKKIQMDFTKLLDFLRDKARFPFQVQICGYKDQDYPFTSQGQGPFERSFSIQEDKPVIMGWPVNIISSPDIETRLHRVNAAQTYPNNLDETRRAVQEFGILHSYHRKISDIDNDFYFRIGLLRPNSRINLVNKEALEKKIRKFLSELDPVIIQVALSDLYIASYSDTKLPLESTRVWSVCDSIVSPAFIESLYE